MNVCNSAAGEGTVFPQDIPPSLQWGWQKPGHPAAPCGHSIGETGAFGEIALSCQSCHVLRDRELNLWLSLLMGKAFIL